MTSWEIALIIGLSAIPFFLQKETEKMEDKSNIIKLIIFTFNIFIFLIVIRLGVMIANLNNTAIGTLVNTFFITWLILSSVLLFSLIFIILPYQLFINKKTKKEDVGLEIEK